MSMVTSGDVQEIASKLSSDKAKAREDGIKLLNTWLEGERSIRFCKYLTQKTAMLKPNEIPHSETWPFLVSLLIKCVSSEISTSKRRMPKLTFAKTIRIVVQRADDSKFSAGKRLLLPVAKLLFNHIWDVLRDVPCFQFEYGIILRHLLSVRDYQFHMRKRVYCSMVLLYMEKVEAGLSGENDGQLNPKEDVFRCILTLYSLIENPPGDFPNDLREDLVRGLIRIFSFVRDEGKISRKLVACVNMYLLKDGPNLDSHCLEIHDALQQSVLRHWTTTHDPTLKDALILYARLQLKLTRSDDDGNDLLEQLVDLVVRELDQINNCSIRSDTSRDDRIGNLTSLQSNLVELAALVFCRACSNTLKATSGEKRPRREHAATHLKEGLTRGKWSWNAAFCCLIRKFHSRVTKDLLIYWFEGICTSFERIINDANVEHAYDGLLWTLRSLQELSLVKLFLVSGKASLATNELDKGWHTIWCCLMHGLPTFSSITSVADAALMLLGNMILWDQTNAFLVSQDVWDLRLFKCFPSKSVLWFLSSYFSKRGSQDDIRDVLHLRQNLLRAVLPSFNWKEHVMLNEQIVVFLPAAAYALCAGFSPLSNFIKGVNPSCLVLDFPETTNDDTTAGHGHLDTHELFECSIDVIADIGECTDAKIMLPINQSSNLPWQLRRPLFNEMESYIFEVIAEVEAEKMLLSDVVFICALLSNILYGSYVTRLREEVKTFLSKLGHYLLELLDHAASVIEKSQTKFRCGGLGSNPIFDNIDSIIVAFRSFAHSPLFSNCTDKNFIDFALYPALTLSSERLLNALVQLYEESFDYARNRQSESDMSELPASNISVQDSYTLNKNRDLIIDMDLDVSDDLKDVEFLIDGGKSGIGISGSLVKQKIETVSLISSFFSISPFATWNVLFSLARRERDSRVLECFLFHLCQHPNWPSSKELSDLVSLMKEIVDIRAKTKLQCLDIIDSIRGLSQTLLSLEAVEADRHIPSRERLPEQVLISLGDLVNKLAEDGLFDWFGRVKLIDCICNFVLLKPLIGQNMIDKLLMMLRDPDYRVRLFLAKRIVVLFQMWDGHDELFQDICSNFGSKLVVFTKGMLVTAKEVLAAGPPHRLMMETIVVTLMHLALQSERIELEAVFMMCVVAAVDPCQRELVSTVLNNLSRQLQYSTRSKYMEELLGPVIFCWVACGVSLAALIETRDLFVLNLEPVSFVQYSCRWLLPALILHGDISGLNWIANVACQPSALLVKTHFVPIFSVCMAMHCSKMPGWEKGASAVQSSILSIADISENERDKLIKSQMVSIVSHIFSLSSSAPQPTLPLFSKDAIVVAVRTIVDGFLEMEDHPRHLGVLDRINIFRLDRVFMFIVDLHYKLTAAIHHRHKCNKLAGIEVLINVLGHRAAVSSTFNYLLNLVGQYIDSDALREQCCNIISDLLKIFHSNPSNESTVLLGQQLQFFVSRLVAFCIQSKSNGECSFEKSCHVLSLLHQLTVDSHLSLHDYIKELEPFPELEIFDRVRKFHEELCKDYLPKDHLLKFVPRSGYLPPRLLLSSLKALHRKMFLREIYHEEKSTENILGFGHWLPNDEVVDAVWSLVHMCSFDEIKCFGALVSDFLSRVGMGDPHSVVFHLPGESTFLHVCRPLNPESATGSSFPTDTGISEELLVSLMKLLKKYLMDDSVETIDMASQVLQGILSTERGQRTLLSFDSWERSLIEVHSKGVNMEFLQNLVLDFERRSTAETLSLENSDLWATLDKSFETWICPLVYTLIGYCDDIILRLCQNIVLLKSEVAELLLPNVLVNLVGRKDFEVDLCELISSQVQENIFIESNSLIKSVQVILNALNELRLCHVMERSGSASIPFKQEISKLQRFDKPGSYGSKSRSTSGKGKGMITSSIESSTSTLSWEKVYWLSIDYLISAKAAINCGSYFTAYLYVEYWCEENYKSLTLGSLDFSHLETLPDQIEILVSAVTQINDPDSLYGIIQSHKLNSQVITFEHEGNWSKALEYYDLQVRSESMVQMSGHSGTSSTVKFQPTVDHTVLNTENSMNERRPYKGLMRSLQKIGCSHILDVYFQGLACQKGWFQHDLEFKELQYEAAWCAGNWDFTLLYGGAKCRTSTPHLESHFNENLHSCLKELQVGGYAEFHKKVQDSKQELLLSLYHSSEESTQYIHSTILKLQILFHLGMAWDLRWKSLYEKMNSSVGMQVSSDPMIPTLKQLSWLNRDWSCILRQAQLHMNLLEPFIAFRRVLLQVLNCTTSKVQHLLESVSVLRKGSRFSQAAAALHEFKLLSNAIGVDYSKFYWLGRIEEAKLLRAQGQHEMAINLAKYISQNYQSNEEASEVHRLAGKWLAESRSSNSRTILEKYLKQAVSLAEDDKATDKKSIVRRSQMHFHLAHYADALFRSHEERLNSNEWQAAMRLRKYKTKELEALIRRLKSSSKVEKIDYSAKIQELQKQLTMDRDEAEKLQDDRDSFLATALEGYKQCLVIADKYDVRVVFRLVSLWFSLSSRPIVVKNMLSTIIEVQSYKFIPLVYQIASRMGSSKDLQGPHTFQAALVSLVKKMTIDHPYHTLLQLLALANGDRIKDKQRSRNSFVVDMDKKIAAENLLKELSSYHGAVIRQMKQMVEIYIKLAELETKREIMLQDPNRKITLPREIRSVRQLELVPVVTANFPIDHSCQYNDGSFPHFRGLGDSVMIMNGINAPKVVECIGSDGNRYRQLAKSGNDDLRQDAVMEQFFGLVNTLLQNHRDTWKRRLRIRTYKVISFTPSAGVLEWVNGTTPLGEYLIGSMRNGGAHGRYGCGDWTFIKCRQHMTTENDKRKAFDDVCENFRPVMHHFFLERFMHPADWFEKRLAYTRSVAASSMVGYIVGLGDRHSMNILIDQATAEVVHIDLGVAFEQGLMLKTPEQVPFRLTRDVIDGMGVTGVEGVFRRCCEEALSVMRTNKEALLTIVEVFIHDPLYKWALSPLKALQRQKEMDDDIETSLEDSEDEYEGNKDAARALMRVKQKLDGYEEGEMRSVHGQVQQLIQDAIDPDRLCQMFPGWGAWL